MITLCDDYCMMTSSNSSPNRKKINIWDCSYRSFGLKLSYINNNRNCKFLRLRGIYITYRSFSIGENRNQIELHLKIHNLQHEKTERPNQAAFLKIKIINYESSRTIQRSTCHLFNSNIKFGFFREQIGKNFGLITNVKRGKTASIRDSPNTYR